MPYVVLQEGKVVKELKLLRSGAWETFLSRHARRGVVGVPQYVNPDTGEFWPRPFEGLIVEER